MDDLNLKGGADFTELFAKLDEFEQRLTRLGNIKAPNVSPRVDLGDSLKQLDELERRLRALGAAGQPTIKPQTPPTPTQQAPVTPQGPAAEDVARAEALRVRLAQIHNEAAILRNDFIAAGTAADITDQEVQQLAQRISTLKGELAELRPVAEKTFGESSAEVKNLTLTAAQLQRTLAGATGQMSRLGIASQFKLALDSTGLFQNPQQNINGIVQLARVYEQARLSSTSFQKTIERQNVKVNEAQKFISEFSDKFNVIPNVVEATTKVLINNGYGLDQAREAMQLYGASALVAAKDVGGAIDAFASDVTTGNTVMSNQYGIQSNLISSYQQYARSIGISVEALTKEQKAEAFLVALRKDAGNDLRDIDEILGGLGGTLGATNKQFREAQQELGKTLLPTVTNGAKQLTGLLEAFNNLSPGTREFIANVAIAGVVVGGLRLVLGPLFALFGSGVGTFQKVGELLGKGGVAKGAAELAEAGAQAASKTAPLTKGLTALGEAGAAGAKGGLFAKLGQSLKGIMPLLTNGASAVGNLVKSLAASPATKGGLYGFVALLGYGVGTLISQIKTLNGLTIGQNVENFSLKAFSGFSQDQVNQFRIDEARNEAFNRVSQQQAETLARVRQEKDKDVRASKLRTLAMEKEMAVEQAALDRAKGIGATGSALQSQNRIKVLTQALGLERQNLATINANILAEQQRKDAEEARRPRLEALSKIQAELASRDVEIRVSAKSDFARDMAEIAREFGEQRKKLENQLKGEKDIVVRAKILQTLDKVDSVQDKATTARVAQETRSGAQEVADAQRAVEQARIGAMRDGAAKRKAELAAELRSIQAEYAPKIKAALEAAQLVSGPERSTLQGQAGEFQRLQREAEAAARATAQQDLGQLQQQQREQAAERVRLVQEAEGRVIAARAESASAAVAALEQQRDREIEVSDGSVAARLSIEQRYARSIAALQQQAQQLRTQQARADLARTYREQMDQAAKAGSERGRLELLARQEYLTNLGTLERTAAEEAAGFQIAAQERVTQARLSLQQQALDKELESIQTATGAELASLRIRLEARKAAALAAGDTRSAAQVTAALKDVASLNTKRVEALRDAIQEASKGAGELRSRLADALPKSLEQRARSEAASPFNSVIQAAQDRLKALQAAAAKVDPASLPGAAFQKAIAQQQAVIQAANLERNRAIVTADQESARQRLATARELSRAETEAALKNTTSYAQQLRLKAQLLTTDRARIAEIDNELNAIRGRVGSEQRVAALQAERLKLSEGLVTAGQEQRQAADAYAESTLAGLRAEVEAADQATKTDADRLRAGQLRVQLAERELDLARQRLAVAVAEGRSPTEINGLRAGVISAQGAAAAARQGIGEVGKEIQDTAMSASEALLKSLISLGAAQQEYADVVARTDAQVLESRRARVEQAAREVQLADVQVSQAQRQGKSEAELNELKAARVRAATQLLQAEQAVRDLAYERSTTELAAEKERVQVQGRLLGLGQDAVAAAQVEVRLTRQQREGLEALLQSADRLRLTDEQRRDLGRQIAETKAEEAEASRQLEQAERDRVTLGRELARAMLDLSRASGEQLSGLDEATGRLGDANATLSQARQDVQQDLSRLASGQGLDEGAVARAQRLTQAYQGQRDALRGLAAEYRRQLEGLDGLEGAVKRLRGILNPAQKDGPLDGPAARRNLQRIEGRRTAALDSLERALSGGDDQAVQEALSRVADSEEAYRTELDRLKKAGLGPYLNLQVQQERRVTGLLERAQDRLDKALAGADQLRQQADALDAQAKAADPALSGLPTLTADALTEALNLGSQRLSDQVLDGLTRGSELVAAAIREALATEVQIIVPPQPTGAAPKDGDVNNVSLVFNWNGQEFPTPPAVQEMVKQIYPGLKDMAQQEQRRSGRECRP